MRFDCDKKDLEHALRLASLGINGRVLNPGFKRPTLFILGYVLLEASEGRLTFTGSDSFTWLQVSLSALVHEPGQICITSPLLDWIAELPDGLVAVASRENELSVRSSSSELTLHSLPGDEFPRPPMVTSETSVSIPASSLRAALSQTLFCASTGPCHAILMSVNFSLRSDRLNLAATDRWRLSVSTVDVEGASSNVSATVPSESVEVLLQALPDSPDAFAELGFADEYLLIRWEGFLMNARLIEGLFPNWERCIPSHSDIHLTASRIELQQAVRRAAAIEPDQVLLMATNGFLFLRARSATGRYTDRLAVNLIGGDLALNLNCWYLLGITEAAGGDTIHLFCPEASESRGTRFVRFADAECVPRLQHVFSDAFSVMPGLETVIADDDGAFIHRILEASPEWIHKRKRNRQGLLHEASYYGSTSIAELLLHRGAQVDVVDADGATPLHIASSRDQKAVAELLLSRGANVNAVSKALGTPLHAAAIRGCVHVAKLLIAKRAEVDEVWDEHGTPLHIAAMHGQEATVRLLLSKGAYINAQDGQGRTPHDIALAQGHEALAEFLQSQAATTLPFFALAVEERPEGHMATVKALTADTPLLDDEAEVFIAKASVSDKEQDIDELLLEINETLRHSPPAKRESIVMRFERNETLAGLLKAKRDHKCQICGFTFRKADGTYYSEVHHLDLLSRGGLDCLENVLVVCANCHRRLHYCDVEVIKRDGDWVELRIDADISRLQLGL